MTVQEIYESSWNDFGFITGALNAAKDKIAAQQQQQLPAGTGRVAAQAAAKPAQGKTKELINKAAAGSNGNGSGTGAVKKTDPENEGKPEKTGKSYSWLYVVIAIIIFVLIAYFVFFRKKGKK